MDIVAGISARIKTSLDVAKELVSVHHQLVEEAKSTMSEERRARLAGEIDAIHKKWHAEMQRCNRLRQLLADYHKNGWEKSKEVKVR